METARKANVFEFMAMLSVCTVFSFGSPGCQEADRTGIPRNNKVIVFGEVSVADVIKVNSEVIDELSRAASVMTQSSDIIMRYRHYTERHSDAVVLCPECTKDSPVGEESGFEEPDEDIPETMVQLLKDSRELRNSVAILTSGLLFQRVALQRHLEKLRAAADAPR